MTQTTATPATRQTIYLDTPKGYTTKYELSYETTPEETLLVITEHYNCYQDRITKIPYPYAESTDPRGALADLANLASIADESRELTPEEYKAEYMGDETTLEDAEKDQKRGQQALGAFYSAFRQSKKAEENKSFYSDLFSEIEVINANINKALEEAGLK